MNEVSVRYPSLELKDLAEVRRFVEETATAFGGEQDAVSELVLAVNEAVCNILTHGYGTRPGIVTIDVSQDRENLEIRLRDQAPTFDPTSVPAPDITVPLNQRKYGGMGVHMMRSLTDEMTYRVTADGWNELVLVKHDALQK
jgi:serine/threonine-protein kinase RsbW